MLQIGKSYLFFTVLYHYIGVLELDCGDFYKLRNSKWVGSLGKLGTAIRTGKVEESEHQGDFLLRKDSLVGIVEWNHDLPSD